MPTPESIEATWQNTVLPALKNCVTLPIEALNVVIKNSTLKELTSQNRPLEAAIRVLVESTTVGKYIRNVPTDWPVGLIGEWYSYPSSVLKAVIGVRLGSSREEFYDDLVRPSLRPEVKTKHPLSSIAFPFYAYDLMYRMDPTGFRIVDGVITGPDQDLLEDMNYPEISKGIARLGAQRYKSVYNQLTIEAQIVNPN